MAIVDTIESIKTNLANAYDIAESKGATIPENRNMENLPPTLASILLGGDYNVESIANADGTQTLVITSATSSTENIVQDGTNLTITSTGAELTQDGTNLTIGG